MSSVDEDRISLKKRLYNFGTYQLVTLIDINLFSEDVRNIISTVTGKYSGPIIILDRNDLEKVIELLEVICE